MPCSVGFEVDPAGVERGSRAALRRGARLVGLQ